MSGNTRVVELFRSNSILVLDELERIPIHATDIRKMLDEKKYHEIKKWVTPGVHAFITTNTI